MTGAATPASRCNRCGQPFTCGLLAGVAPCWCASLPALPGTRLDPAATCLCPACLKARLDTADAMAPKSALR
jgi:hypothetical protein